MTVASYIFPILTGLLAIIMIVWPERNVGNMVFLSPARWVGLGFLILFSIQPLNHIYYGQVSLDVLAPQFFDPMAVLCFLCLFGFVLGWSSYKPVPNRRTISSFDDGRATIAILVLCVPAVLSIVFLITAYQGLRGYLVDTATAPMRVAEGLYNIMAWMFCAIVVIAIVGLALLAVRPRWSMFFVALIALTAALTISIRLAARLRVVLIVLAVMGVIATRLSSRHFRNVVLIAAMLLLPFVYVQRIVRYNFSYTTGAGDIWERVSQRADDLYYDVFMTGDFDAFENGMQLVRAVPYYHSFLYGSTLASVLINPIPRALWPSKPSPSVTDILAATGFGKGSGVSLNIACSLPGELYVNGWWFGALGVMYLYGRLARWYYSQRRRTKDPFAAAELGLFSAYMLLVLRGSFHVMTVYYLMVLSWMLVAKFILRYSRVAAFRVRPATATTL